MTDIVDKRAHYSPPWADVSIIGIAGSSGSGKSTLSHAIVSKLSLPWVVILSMVRNDKLLGDIIIDFIVRIHFTNHWTKNHLVKRFEMNMISILQKPLTSTYWSIGYVISKQGRLVPFRLIRNSQQN